MIDVFVPRPVDNPGLVKQFDEFLALLREAFLTSVAAEWSIEPPKPAFDVHMHEVETGITIKFAHRPPAAL